MHGASTCISPPPAGGSIFYVQRRKEVKNGIIALYIALKAMKSMLILHINSGCVRLQNRLLCQPQHYLSQRFPQGRALREQSAGHRAE
jgi:hypothetical protein